MGELVRLQEIDQFKKISRVPKEAVTSEILNNVRMLNERSELEPMLRGILGDPTETPHGPTEIADILTNKIILRGKPTNTAFVLKGKSFKQVQSAGVSHQFVRLRQLPGLGLIILVAVGNIQDDAKRDFFQVAEDGDYDYLIIEALDCARLLLAYKKICQYDGTPYGPEGECRQGHKQDKGVELKIRVEEGLHFEKHKISDLSHSGARRLSATVLVFPCYSREVMREIIKDATEQVRVIRNYRNDQVTKQWQDTDAHVVWLFLAGSLQDLRNNNWLARSQWISPNLDQEMWPLTLDASEFYEGIAIAWNQSYDEMRDFYEKHSVDKGEALRMLEPLINKATEVGCMIADSFDSVDRGDMEEHFLIADIAQKADMIQFIENSASNLPFPPEDIKDYDERAQSLVAHLGNMALYYSTSGLETWPQAIRINLMRATVTDFRKDLERLIFEKEKLH